MSDASHTDPIREMAAERIAAAISPHGPTPFTRGLAHGLLGRLRYDADTRAAVMAWLDTSGGVS